MASVVCTGPRCLLCQMGGWTVSRRRWLWMRLCAKLRRYRGLLRGRGSGMTAGVDVMGQRVIAREVGGYVVRFAWEGGAYIDIRVHGRAVDVINVWDCYTDTPRIPRTTEGLAARVDEWIAEYGEAFVGDLARGNYA